MGDKLSNVLGLPENSDQESSYVSAAAKAFSDAFAQAMDAVNRGLQTLAAQASPDEHGHISGQRDKVITAFQKVLKQFSGDGATEPQRDAARNADRLR